MFTLTSHESYSESGDGSFEDIFRIPSCDSALSSRLQELSVFKGAEQSRRLKLDPTDGNSCESSVRRCLSDSTGGTAASYDIPVSSKDDSFEVLRRCSSVDRRRPTNRALYNLRVGLLAHDEFMKARRHPPAPSSSPDTACAIFPHSSSSRSQDAVWDLLLQ